MQKHAWLSIKRGWRAVALIAIIPGSVWATTISNPQSDFAGARSIGLGGGSPVLLAEPSTLFLNPASLSDVTTTLVDLSFTQPLSEFSTLSIAGATPLYGFGIGLAYAQQSADNLYSTVLENNRVRPTTQFSAGIRSMVSSISHSFDRIWIFPKFALGSNIKWTNQFIDTDQRSIISADFGATTTLKKPFQWIDNLTLGLSVVNGFSTSSTWPSNGLSGTFSPEIHTGAAIGTLNDHLHFFIHNDRSAVVGAEYALHNDVKIRAATDFSKFEIGIGVLLDRLSGIGQSPVQLKLDYAYSQIGIGSAQPPWSSFTFRYLGLSQSSTPIIQLPVSGTQTDNDYIEIEGSAAKQTEITLFNKGLPIKKLSTDPSGYWKMDIPLYPGENRIQAQAKDIDSLSEMSASTVIYSSKGIDQLEPDLQVIKDQLWIRIPRGNNQSPDGKVNTTPISFTQDGGFWVANITPILPFPVHRFISDQFVSVSITPKSETGNALQTTTIPIFLRAIKGIDRSVTYSHSADLVGQVSPIVHKLQIAESPLHIEQGYYSTNTLLNLGMNTIVFTVTLSNGKKLMLHSRITRLQELKDINTSNPQIKKQIEALATIGALPFIRQSQFNEDAPLTLSNVVEFLSRHLNLETTPMKQVLTFDQLSTQVSPIESSYRLLISRGIIDGAVNSVFIANRPIQSTELQNILSKSGIHSSEVIKPSGTITRKEFALILLASPEFQSRVQALLEN